LSEAAVDADGRLGGELAEILEPSVRDALNHPTRRGILGVLHREGQACGVTEILGQLRPLSRAEVGYHLRVLRGAGVVVADGTRPSLRGRDDVFRSALADDPGVLAVLAVTAQWDRRRREGAGEGRSSGLLTMFRVPRTGRAIDLSLRSARKAKPGA
jgi:DNA-binding transcriptional ArsR family regulator